MILLAVGLPIGVWAGVTLAWMQAAAFAAAFDVVGHVQARFIAGMHRRWSTSSLSGVSKKLPIGGLSHQLHTLFMLGRMR